jgi:hypothetical protein
MTKRFFAVLPILLLLVLAISCGNEDNSPNSPLNSLDGADLLGLIDNRTFDYFEIDTVITLLPIRTVKIDTSIHRFSVTGSGNDWIVSDSAGDMLNLKLSDPYVLQNGYWREEGDSSILVYFATPAILMNRSLEVNQSWDSHTPHYTVEGGSLSFPFYFSYFGYFTTKTYVGREEVLVPAGAYDAYRFDVELYANVTDATPTATVEEYFSPSVGLVKLSFRGLGLSRTLNLIEYE